MSQIVLIPDINPIRFAEEDKIIPTDVGFPAFGEALQIDSTKPLQVLEQWYQPFTNTDTICIQFKRARKGIGGWNFTVLNIETPEGEFITYMNPTSQINNYEIDPVTGERLDAVQFLFTFGSIDALAGYEYVVLRLKVAYGDGEDIGEGTTETYRSNPIHLADEHPDTIRIEYHNNSNDYGIAFEQMSPRFMFRFPTSRILTYEPAGTFDVFTDHKKREVKLSGVSTNQYKLDIGGVDGVPEYVIDILDEALNCDNIRIGSRLYSRVSKELELQGSPEVHRKRVFAKLQDKGNIFSFSQAQILGWTRPASGFPYAIDYAQITDGFIYTGVGAKAFFDEDDEDDTLVGLNAQLTYLGLGAQWVKVDESGVIKFYLVNGPGERFGLNGKPIQVFPTRLRLELQVNTAGDNFRYQFVYPTPSIVYQHVACYADSQGQEVLHSSAVGVGVTIANFTFSTTGAHVVNIFTRDQETAISSVHGSACPVEITDWDNDVPKTCQQIYFNAHPFNGSAKLSLTPTNRCEKNIINTTFRYSSITGIATGWASGIAIGGYKGYAKAWGYEISNAALGVGDVDNFINEVHDYTDFKTFPPPGKPYVLDVSGNSPSAAPTGASAASEANLNSNGWNVFHD